MGRGLNAKLKSLDFRLKQAIESSWKAQSAGGVCILNYPWHRVENG